jgi:hypothetical protein
MSLGRKIVIDTGWQTVAAVQDLIEIKLAASQAGFVKRAKIMQSSEETASEAEELQVALKRGSGGYTSGTGGAVITQIVKGNTGDAAHGFTAFNRNNTTQAAVGSGALEPIEPGVFAVLAGEWDVAYTPDEELPIGPSQGIIVSLDEAPVDALTLRAILVLNITHG